MENSTLGAVERITGKLKKDLDSATYASLATGALTNLDTAATGLSAEDWTYFNLAYYNGGSVPSSGSIMTRLFVTT
jgi:hypothetical protein